MRTAELAAAEQAILAAEDRLRDLLAAEFPIGCSVLVTHYHGSFTGVVHCHYHSPGHIQVKNDRSDKKSKRHFSDLKKLASVPA